MTLDAQTPLTERFIRLSPERVFDEVEVIGRRCTGRYLVLNSYENRVYNFEMEDGPDVVGKFYRPGRWSRDTIADEHAFLAELAEAELPVVCPLDLGGGATIGETGEGILYSLYPRVRGRAPQELNDEQLGVLGRLLARLHNVGAVGDAPHRVRLSVRTYGWDNLQYLIDGGHIPAEARAGYVAVARALFERIEPLFQGVPVHRIHGDCHLGNLIWTTGPTFLDFDDLVVGPAVQDVWMLVASFDLEGAEQRQKLIAAYEQFRDFDWDHLQLIEPLRALRYVHYSAWIARRWNDPLFRQVFSHFGTVRYWQQETNDLREQIARIDHERDRRAWN